jgi:hypothetical protein
MVGKPGVFFDYITPILGKPWAIPLELPFYQWIVARWRDFTGMGLDQSGKLVSIGFLLPRLADLENTRRPIRLALAVFLLLPLKNSVERVTPFRIFFDFMTNDGVSGGILEGADLGNASLFF